VDEDGKPEPWAAEIVRRLASYTEYSPTGTGLHVIVRGGLPGGRNRKGPIEMYDRGRFFTVTGRPLPGLPATVEDRGGALAALYRETFGDGQGDTYGALPEPVSPPMGDDEVLALCRGARNAGKFEALYDDGDLDGHGGDHSAADLALIMVMSLYTQDEEQLDRLFRRSALVRDKWTSRPDYRERTIRFALSADREYYGAEREWPTVTFIDDMRDGYDK
jgi:primase-polymerase (primpol)-like protein